MAWRPQINEKGNIACWRNTETGEVLTAKQYEAHYDAGFDVGAG